MARIKTLTQIDRGALEQLWEEAGAWAAATWDRLNAQCFAGEVPYHGVVWGLTPHGRSLGHCSHTGRITLHPALLNPKSNAWGVHHTAFGDRYAADVLVHEMIHALLRARGVPQTGNGEHNTQPWCDELMRITPLLGLAPIQAAPIHPTRGKGGKGSPSRVRVAKPGHLTHKQLATWPHPLRPKGYYAKSNHQMRVPI